MSRCYYKPKTISQKESTGVQVHGMLPRSEREPRRSIVGGRRVQMTTQDLKIKVVIPAMEVRSFYSSEEVE